MSVVRLLGCALVATMIAASCGGDPPETSASVEALETDPPNPAVDPAPTATVAPTTRPTTEPEITETPIATATVAPTPEPPCVRLTDFDDDGGAWRIVNDGVMGGLSQGRASVADGVLTFDGTIVTDGGGFSMVRAGVADGALQGVTSLRFRLRPDDRSYELIADDAQEGVRSSVSHFGALVTDGSDWQEVDVALDELVARSFGTPVDSEPFRPDLALSLGIILSDGVDGPFSLQVDWLDACV